MRQYCFEKEFDSESLKVLALLKEQKLDMRTSFFRVNMQANCKHALELPLT
jgi:hypothetical protein